MARIELDKLNPDSKSMSSALCTAAQNGYGELLVTFTNYALARQFGRGVFVGGLLQCARHSQTANFRTLWNAACYQDKTPVPEEQWCRDQHIGYGTPCSFDLYNPYYPFLLGLSDLAFKSHSNEILEIVSKARFQSMVHQLDHFQKEGKSPPMHEWLNKTLVQAAKMGQLTKDEFQLLFDAGADPNALSEVDETTPLIAAIDGRHTGIVKMLLEHGADPNLQIQKCWGYYTEPPLLAASRQPRSLEMLCLLFEHGASVNRRVKQGPSMHRTQYQTSDDFSSRDDSSKDEILCYNESQYDEAQCDSQDDDSQDHHSQDHHSKDGHSRDDEPQDNASQDDLERSDISSEHLEDQLVLTQAISYALYPYPTRSRRSSSVGSNSSDSAAQTSPTKVAELLLEYNADSSVVAQALVPALYHILTSETLEVETLQFMLAHCVDVNAPQGHYASPLSALIELSEGPMDIKVIELLLQHGAKVDSGSHKRKSPLQCAVSKPPDSPREQIIEILIQHGANINARHFEGSNALQFACQNSADERMITFLLSMGANVNAPGGRLGDSLQVACYKHHDLKMVELLLLQGADVNASVGKWGAALQAACFSSHPVRLMRLLHAHRANPNAQGGRYGCALQAACSLDAQKVAAVEYLLQMGADVNLGGGRYGSALICACFMGNDSAVRLLLEHAADTTYTHHIYGNALHAACMAGRSSTVQLLLQRGMSADEHGGIYNHAMFAALFHQDDEQSHKKIIRLVAREMRDLNFRNSDFGTPLIAVVLAGERNLVQDLLDRGADINLHGGRYGTPLQAAAARSDKAMVLLLLKNSADVNALGGRYGTALQAASARNKVRIRIRRRGRKELESPDRARPTRSSETNDNYMTSSDTSSAYSINSSAESRRHRLKAKYIWMAGLEIVDLLIKHGADVNAVGGTYGTALHAAIHFRHEDVIEKLLATEAQLTDAITSCHVKGSRVQCRERVADRKLHRSGVSEGEDSDLPQNQDWIGERERCIIYLSEDESDKERGKFHCGTGIMAQAREQEERREKRKLL